MAEVERRSYIRDNYFYSGATVRVKGGHKHKVTVFDFSAGGVKFRAEKDLGFAIGDVMDFDTIIGSFPKFAETQIATPVKIRRVIPEDGGQVSYGASFMEISPELRIRIDEIILYKKRKSKEEA